MRTCGVGTRSAANRVLYSDILSDLLLESLNIWTENEVLGFEDTGDGGFHLRLDLLVLCAKVEKWELQGSLPIRRNRAAEHNILNDLRTAGDLARASGRLV